MTRTQPSEESLETQTQNEDLFTCFIPGGTNDPGFGYAWCFSCEPGIRSVNKVVHYIRGYGWLGHGDCILEAISSDETEAFQLSLPGNVGRRHRITYQYLRLLAPETFVRTFLAPHFNREFRKHRCNRISLRQKGEGNR